MTKDSKGWPSLLGKILVTSVVQISLASIEIPSKLLIRTQITTQEYADAFITELQAYIIIGAVWAIGTSLLVYVSHYHFGALLNLVLNLLIMYWIVSRHYRVYLENVRKYQLHTISLFDFGKHQQ